MQKLISEFQNPGSVNIHAQIIFLLLFIVPGHPGITQEHHQVRELDLRAIRMIDLGSVIVNQYNDNREIVRSGDPDERVRVRSQETYVIRAEDPVIREMSQMDYSQLEDPIRAAIPMSDIRILPEVFVKPGAAEADDLYYRLAFESRLPLEYDHQEDLFLGSVKFFLIATAGGQNPSLNEPVQFEVVSNDIQHIEPALENINHISIPLTEIHLRGKDLADSAHIKILTRTNPDGYTTHLPVKPAIRLKPSRTHIPGLGVGKIPIDVFALGTRHSQTFQTNLSVERGSLSLDQIEISHQRPGKVELRSSGLGSVSMTANTTDWESNPVVLYYTFPWLFLGLALLGGILAGITRKVDPKKISRSKIIIVNAILGFVAAGLFYVLEYNFFKFDMSTAINEIGICIIAFIGARLFHSKGLERVLGTE